MGEQQPSVSVVIRAFNEEKHLAPLLTAITGQSLADTEVVVVDSGSYDRTPEIARDHGATLITIRSSDFTFGYSLNEGIRQCRGSRVAIVSAHTLPCDERWLERLVSPLEDPGVAMVYGRQLGTSDSKYSEVRDFVRTFGPNRQLLAPPNFFANNANSAIRRDLWEQYPFDETLPGLEDIDWAKYWMERGRRVVYEPEAGIYHIHEESWRQVRRRYYREGVAAKWIGLKGRSDIPREIGTDVWRLVADLGMAARDRQLAARLKEIALFRYHKSRGTVRGLWDGAALGDPRERESVLFDARGRAVVIHEKGKASLEEVEVPMLRPGEVLIRVGYVGVCGTDLEILDETLGYYKTGMAQYPITPGHEFSGTILRVGANVEGLERGNRVVVECIQTCHRCDACHAGNFIGCDERREVGVIGQSGAYADYVVVQGRFVHRLPDQVDLRVGALTEPLAVVLKGLRRLERFWGSARPRKVGVVGAGPIGHLTALVLAQRGHEVFVYDRNPERVRLMQEAEPGLTASSDLSGIAALEAVVEATGSPEALDAAIHGTSSGTALLLLGLPYARRPYSFEDIVAYDKIVIGSVGSSAEDFREAIRTLPELNTERLTDRVLPLDRFQAAWREARAGEALKVLLQVDAAPVG